MFAERRRDWGESRQPFGHEGQHAMLRRHPCENHRIDVPELLDAQPVPAKERGQQRIETAKAVDRPRWGSRCARI
jgi:hypothetical protein